MAIPALKFSSQSTKPREICPEGTFQAELIRVYYCGLQENKFNLDNPQPKIIFAFELDEPLLESDGNHILSTTVTYSLNEKSGLTKLLKPVLGSQFPDKPGQELDVDSLVGMKVMVTVSHTKKDDGRVFANIAGLARLPRGMQPFTATMDAFAWSCDDADDPNTDKVPGWVKEFAEKRISPEMVARQKEEQSKAKQVLAPLTSIKAMPVTNDDDMPF